METDEVAKPSGSQSSLTNKSTELVNPEKGLGLDNAIIHSIGYCGMFQDGVMCVVLYIMVL